MEAYGLGEEDANPGSKFAAKANQLKIRILDRLSPQVTLRWLIWAGLLVGFALRIWYVKGFYIVAYALGIFNLNLLLGFLSPQIDPELEGPVLPSKNEEFRPFVRRLPEFKFWYSSCKAFCIGFVATFFAVFDVPVFWPILLLYWFVLFFLTMKRQIRHMIKYQYVPFSIGKKTYAGSQGSLGSKSLGKDQNGTK